MEPPIARHGGGRLVTQPGQRTFGSMSQASSVMGIPMGILKDAKSSGCTAFRAHGTISEYEFLAWMVENRGWRVEKGVGIPPVSAPPQEESDSAGDDEPADDDQTGAERGAGAAMARLEALELQAYKRFNKLTRGEGASQEKIDKALQTMVKLQKALLDFEQRLDDSKRSKGETLQKADVMLAFRALIAWMRIGETTALRQVVPELEGQTKETMLKLLRESRDLYVTKAIKSGVAIGKIPPWMGDAVSELLFDHEPP